MAKQLQLNLNISYYYTLCPKLFMLFKILIEVFFLNTNFFLYDLNFSQIILEVLM